MITYVHHTNTSIILDSSVDTESVEVEWSAWVYKSHICKNNIRYVGVEARSSRRPNGQIGAGRRGIPFSVLYGVMTVMLTAWTTPAAHLVAGQSMIHCKLVN